MTQCVNDPTDVVVALSGELAGVLEMVFEPAEMQRLFPGALGGLRLAKQYFISRGLPVPAVVEHVLART